MKNKRIEIVEIEEGCTVEVFKADITEMVQIEVYDNSEAALLFGAFEVEFNWSETAATVFENLTSDQLTLLAVLAK